MSALFKSKTDMSDRISIMKVTTLKECFMLKSDFEDELGFVVAKVYPTKASAIAAAEGKAVIKVTLTRDFE